MKALILAAGLGSRLAPLTDDRPKALVPVNGQPILLRQIENLTENGVTDISVVTGYRGEMIEAALAQTCPAVHIIHNREYASTNNMYSAWLGREAVRGGGFLMMNADVFYDASVVRALLAFPEENAIVTDIGTYLEESMKVTVKDGRIDRISKTVTEREALGASIDVYKFSEAGGRAYFAKCEEYILTRGDRGKWSEVALNDILDTVAFAPCPLDGRWMEIDDLEDLKRAGRIFA